MLFWNGNRSPARQVYERAILQAVLEVTEGPKEFEEDLTDYPRAEDEGNLFNKDIDVLVTVSGNPKFAGKEKIVLDQPIAKGLLGHRLLIVREEEVAFYASIQEEKELQAKVCGIPETWADAGIFAANGYRHLEMGSFGEIFDRLRRGQFDYVALGAFEVEEAFDSMARPVGGLAIDDSLMLKYPMPLVFYVHPRRRDLADRIKSGLRYITEAGVLDGIFGQHFSQVLERQNISGRRVLLMQNPFLSQG